MGLTQNNKMTNSQEQFEEYHSNYDNQSRSSRSSGFKQNTLITGLKEPEKIAEAY